MGLELYRYYDGLGAASPLLALSIMFLAGFLMSRITKALSLPNVTGYILAGVLIGPSLLGLISPEMIDGMSFLSDLALAFIAFGVGKFFRKDSLKEGGKGVILVTLLESLLAGALVFLAVFLIFPDLGWQFALLLGAVATATAPASTLMTIAQYKAKGRFVNLLLQVVALDDVVCLLAFTFASALVEAQGQGALSAEQILYPLLYNLLILIAGFLSGFLLHMLVKGRSPNSRLVIAVALIAFLAGTAILLDVSPLLAAMAFGASYRNVSHDEKLFKYIDHFDPPVMLLFFVLSGMSMDFSAFLTVGAVGVTYFIVRLVGKYAGAWAGAALSREEKPVRNYLGLALAPQAGVAIGLAFLGERLLPAEQGTLFLSIILCSSILYELSGPALAKLALVKSGAIPQEMLEERRKPLFHRLRRSER